ncbi:MAG TPA: hypothetical protein VFB20_17340 [Burkholderiales bacterium]|nr:hypothetical protein [Burkholderiales bacterium]
MMQCAHCDIVVEDRPYVADGKVYCCELCFLARTQLEEAYAERVPRQLIGALVRSLDARESDTANTPSAWRAKRICSAAFSA